LNYVRDSVVPGNIDILIMPISVEISALMFLADQHARNELSTTLGLDKFFY